VIVEMTPLAERWFSKSEAANRKRRDNAANSVLLGKNGLRQRTRRKLVRKAGVRIIVCNVRRRQGVVGIDDRCLAVLWVNGDLKKVQQIARPWSATSASHADNTMVIARSRVRPSICNLVRIDQTCFGRSGGFAPVNLPLFQGTRLNAIGSAFS
jgi:hypothetical protein